jgi:hypothetical protein
MDDIELLKKVSRQSEDDGDHDHGLPGNRSGMTALSGGL